MTEVIIYDAPPSVGATLWVEEKIWAQASCDVEIVSNFVKLKTILHVDLPNKDLLARMREAFLQDIEVAQRAGKQRIIFDGSPITLNALEHLKTGNISSKSRKAAVRCLEEVRWKVSIVLLKPQFHFRRVWNMKYFDENQVVPFGLSLEQAYLDTWLLPTVVEVGASPYRMNP